MKIKDYKYLIRQIEDALSYFDVCVRSQETKNKDWADGVNFAKEILNNIIDCGCQITSIKKGEWRNG